MKAVSNFVRQAVVIALSMAVVIGVFVAPANARSQQKIAVPTPIQGQGYTLVKNWDFGKNVTTLAELHNQFFMKYQYNNGNLDYLNDEWERYSDNDNHVFDGKTLGLVARAPGGLVSGGIQSGMIRSKWVGEYGYFEARIKVPPGRGFWPAFWLNCADEKWPPEIDILEIVNNGRDTTKNSYHFIHPSDTFPSTELASRLNTYKSYVPGFDYAEGYHTFSCLWTPEKVTQYVDGVPVVTRTMAWKHADGSDGGPACVLLNLAVGGKWPGDPVSLGEFPATMSVQYVRVWQNPTISKNDGVTTH